MAAAAGSQHRCVFVGNIPYDATEEQLIQICEEVGPVVSFRLVLDRETGKPKGYGFCEYKDEETALSARRNLQGYEINGRQLRVDFAENDKGNDRNREQGRGGPGLAPTAGCFLLFFSFIFPFSFFHFDLFYSLMLLSLLMLSAKIADAHKALPGPPVLGDFTPHQPIGLPLAAAAASAMARTLGGSQNSSSPLIQNGPQNLSGLGNDPLTQYLAKMSRQQLNEIMFEMKALVVQNKSLAEQLLHDVSQLPKALFQAQIMLGMVTPQMMQIASTRQPLNSFPNSLQPSHHGQTPQNEALVGSLSRPPETQSNALQNPLGVQQFALPFQQIPLQPPFQQPLPSQPQVQPQGMTLGKSGVPVPPQSFVNLANQPQVPPLPNSKGLISQVQPPLLQHSRPAGPTNVGYHPPRALPDKNVQQSYLPHPIATQTGSSAYPELLNGLGTLSKEASTSTSVNHDLSWASRAKNLPGSGMVLGEQTGMTGEISGMLNHQPKRPKLEEGGGTHPFITSSFHTSSISAQPIGSGRTVGSQTANHADVKQHAEKQVLQIPPDVESALLQQVMNLTPEQVSLLPLEQRQQVIQIQQMLLEGKR
ncbi:cleavage stimulating factor 64-like [Iris pallida]|uniref:Cleavage stimulating factor 64-like n=1 Tax=Iris pallida TaxID=29817 RepID=A0AAX6FLB1_IRIPA|nr:cleavage stimulating factor 64-like [Iris pallida]